jgi:hypothetical protein
MVMRALYLAFPRSRAVSSIGSEAENVRGGRRDHQIAAFGQLLQVVRVGAGRSADDDKVRSGDLLHGLPLIGYRELKPPGERSAHFRAVRF